jgi:hypothetical protein
MQSLEFTWTISALTGLYHADCLVRSVTHVSSACHVLMSSVSASSWVLNASSSELRLPD